MYVCIVITYSKGKDQPGKAANPARGQLLAEQGKLFLPCLRLRERIWSRETGSAVSSRVSLLISIHRLNLVLTYGIPPEFRGGVHILWVYTLCNMNAAVHTHMYIQCTIISVALLSCSVSSTNEFPRIK